MSTARRIAVVVPAAAALTALVALPASASPPSVSAQLQPLQSSSAVTGTGGTATVTVRGTMVDVTLQASGLLAGAPHAAHIHFGEQARHQCPSLTDDDTDGDGNLSTSEGASDYGPVVISLTTSGDTSPASTLAIDRYSTAPGGTISYQRGSIRTSREVAKAIRDGLAVVVVHGVDYNNSGTYDGDEKSDLEASLPAEATDPALCGALNR